MLWVLVEIWRIQGPWVVLGEPRNIELGCQKYGLRLPGNRYEMSKLGYFSKTTF